MNSMSIVGSTKMTSEEWRYHTNATNFIFVWNNYPSIDIVKETLNNIRQKRGDGKVQYWMFGVEGLLPGMF